MRSSLTRITCETLAKMLGLPEGVTIDAVFQDYQDLASDTVSFRLRGFGDERPEGGQFKYVAIGDISGLSAHVESVGFAERDVMTGNNFA